MTIAELDAALAARIAKLQVHLVGLRQDVAQVGYARADEMLGFAHGLLVFARGRLPTQLARAREHASQRMTCASNGLAATQAVRIAGFCQLLHSQRRHCTA